MALSIKHKFVHQSITSLSYLDQPSTANQNASTSSYMKAQLYTNEGKD